MKYWVNSTGNLQSVLDINSGEGIRMRKRISLNGTWFFLAELEPVYHGLNYKNPHWDRRNWERVKIPGCWNKYAEKYAFFEGVAWYAREFCINETTTHTMAHFKFGAINYLSDIFLNGAHIGTHEGGYTEFLADATSGIKKGNNVVAIRVDNRRHIIKFPAVMGWFNYGGIYKDVELVLSRRIFIEHFFVSAFPQLNNAKGEIILKIKSESSFSAECNLKITDNSEKVVYQDSKNYDISAGNSDLAQSFRFESPQTWDMANPYLYKAMLEVKDKEGSVLDNVSSNFGVRNIKTEGQKILLNDKVVKLKGICYLPDHPKTGIMLNSFVIKSDLKDMKELGVNAIRCHFPLDERFLDECDKRGILVWSEVPIYCVYAKDKKTIHFTEKGYTVLAKQMIREMVIQSYNHPSIAIWSIGNECNESHPAAKEFFKNLVLEIRQIDKNRPIGYACCAFDSTSCTFTLGAIGEIIDCIGINEYMGWYDRCHDPSKKFDLSNLDKALAKLKSFNKPVIMTEFAADAVGGYRADESMLWSEEYQSFFYRETFKLIQKHRHIAGTFPFLYNDYMDPSKPVDGHWDGQNLKGFVTYNRIKKLSFETLRQIYKNLR